MSIFSKKQLKVDELTLLPQSVAELDTYVSEICKEFNLPETDDTYDSIATMIMHVPPSAAKVPMRFFGESVQKSIANKAAYTKLREFSAKREAAAEAAKQVETAPVEAVSTNEQPIQNS